MKESVMFYELCKKSTSLYERQLNWGDSLLLNSRRAGKAESLATWFSPILSEPVMKGRNNSIKVGDCKNFKFQTSRFMNIETSVF